MEEVNGEGLIARFTEDLKTAGRSGDTIKSYVSTVRQFCTFVNGGLLNVTKENLQGYLNNMRSRNLRKSSIKRHFTILSEFYKFLIYNELYTSANPITAFRERYLKEYKGSSGGGERYCPTTTEVIALVNSVLNTRDKAIIVMLFKTGVRRKELSELDVSDVDLEKLTAILKPTAKRTNRRVYFDDECAYILSRWLTRRETLNANNNPALFLTKDGTRMSRGAIDDMFLKYSRAAGFTGTRIESKLTPHCCRHWFTTELEEAGMSYEHYSHLRGDKGTASASRYIHVKEKKLLEEYLRCIPRLGIL